MPLISFSIENIKYSLGLLHVLKSLDNTPTAHAHVDVLTTPAGIEKHNCSHELRLALERWQGDVTSAGCEFPLKMTKSFSVSVLTRFISTRSGMLDTFVIFRE